MAEVGSDTSPATVVARCPAFRTDMRNGTAPDGGAATTPDRRGSTAPASDGRTRTAPGRTGTAPTKCRHARTAERTSAIAGVSRGRVVIR